MHWAGAFAARKEEPGQLELGQVLSAHPPLRAVSEKSWPSQTPRLRMGVSEGAE